MRVTLVDPNIGYSPLPNIGLAALITSIESKHSVCLLDLTFQWRNYIRYFEKYILAEKPDILGFSVSSFTYFTGLKLAYLAKKIYPDIYIVFGGVHPTVCPEEVIRQPVIDSICIGEGEVSFSQFLHKLQEGSEPEIDGYWFKNKSGDIIRNRLRPFEPDLDILPFANWDHFDIERYFSASFIQTGIGGLMHLASRGCPNNCNFCSVHVIRKSVPGAYYRVRSAQNIIEEIKLNKDKYWDRGFRYVHMLDGIFGADWQSFEEFCNLYKEEGLDRVLPWSCMTCPEIVTEDWAKLASESGCARVSIGVETANERLRNEIYRKTSSNKQIEDAIANLRKHNIYYAFFMMIGCPEESRETIKQSIDFIKRYSPIEVRMRFSQPHPRTDYSRMIGKVLDETGKEHAVLKADDVCRSDTKYLSTKELSLAILYYRVWWVFKWLKDDFSRFGFVFLIDIIKYILNIGGIRPIPLSDPYTYKIIKARTHLKYYLDLWKRRRGIKI